MQEKFQPIPDETRPNKYQEATCQEIIKKTPRYWSEQLSIQINKIDNLSLDENNQDRFGNSIKILKEKLNEYHDKVDNYPKHFLVLNQEDLSAVNNLVLICKLIQSNLTIEVGIKKLGEFQRRIRKQKEKNLPVELESKQFNQPRRSSIEWKNIESPEFKSKQEALNYLRNYLRKIYISGAMRLDDPKSWKKRNAVIKDIEFSKNNPKSLEGHLDEEIRKNQNNPYVKKILSDIKEKIFGDVEKTKLQ